MRPIRGGAGVNSQLEGDYYVDPEVNDVEICDSEGGKLLWSCLSIECNGTHFFIFLEQINRIKATT